jgi:putative chitinase
MTTSTFAQQKLKEYNVTEPLEIAHFLAQADHESAGFKRFSEGSNYTFNRAKVIWPSRAEIIKHKQLLIYGGLTSLDVEELYKTEEGRKKIALIIKESDGNYVAQPFLFNLTYGSRMGNENDGTDDDDGYNFRGAGIFQVTGKANYTDFIKWLGNEKITLDNVRKYCLTEEGAVLSAIWFWITKGIGKYALQDDIEAVTRKINGGLNGLADRKKHLLAYKKLMRIK